ncbi:MAG: hypothetical protein HKP27_02455 [Myxococcales bacterium]|nr:hypothetical protein [Myxococcales bacterium]
MVERTRTVAIVGGGPAGAALATYLVRDGFEVVLFAPERRPPLVVGESLVPAVIPFLRELGIEERIREQAITKRGATFTVGPEDQFCFRFTDARGAETPYSYNVPRDVLDREILGAARDAGVHILPEAAKLDRTEDSDRVQLSVDSLSATHGVLQRQPDLIVDAGGRGRLIGRLLDLPTVEGPRRDTALFSHMEGVPLVVEGDVHSDILEHGWSWRIPLPGRVSVGFVVPDEHWERYGATKEERYDTLFRSDPAVLRWGGTPRRVAPVLKYNNYQRITSRGVGPGWALLGDAFGFVDPVFSSGMLIALDGAKQLARAVRKGTPDAFGAYEAHVKRHLAAWQRVIEHFYNGRLLTLFRVGSYMRETIPGRVLDPHFRKHLPRVFTGEASTRRYSVGLTDFMCRYALAGNDPDPFRVR